MLNSYTELYFWSLLYSINCYVSFLIKLHNLLLLYDHLWFSNALAILVNRWTDYPKITLNLLSDPHVVTRTNLRPINILTEKKHYFFVVQKNTRCRNLFTQLSLLCLHAESECQEDRVVGTAFGVRAGLDTEHQFPPVPTSSVTCSTGFLFCETETPPPTCGVAMM